MKSLEFDINAFEDLSWWVEKDRKSAIKIIKLIKEIQMDTFNGIGKPEALKNNFSGLWSRRLNNEHRIVYQVFEEKIRILSCRFHYDD
jgi:toxin YoeB